MSIIEFYANFKKDFIVLTRKRRQRLSKREKILLLSSRILSSCFLPPYTQYICLALFLLTNTDMLIRNFFSLFVLRVMHKGSIVSLDALEREKKMRKKTKSHCFFSESKEVAKINL